MPVMTARCWIRRLWRMRLQLSGCGLGGAGMPTGTEEEAVAAARELMKGGPMGYVLVKRGAAGSLLITGAYPDPRHQYGYYQQHSSDCVSCKLQPAPAALRMRAAQSTCHDLACRQCRTT